MRLNRFAWAVALVLLSAGVGVGGDQAAPGDPVGAGVSRRPHRRFHGGRHGPRAGLVEGGMAGAHPARGSRPCSSHPLQDALLLHRPVRADGRRRPHADRDDEGGLPRPVERGRFRVLPVAGPTPPRVLRVPRSRHSATSCPSWCPISAASSTAGARGTTRARGRPGRPSPSGAARPRRVRPSRAGRPRCSSRRACSSLSRTCRRRAARGGAPTSTAWTTTAAGRPAGTGRRSGARSISPTSSARSCSSSRRHFSQTSPPPHDFLPARA